ncbi:MAG: hypothetical protein ABEI75_00990 [Halobaculum sp.]
MRRAGMAGVGGISTIGTSSGSAAAELAAPSQSTTEEMLAEHAGELFETLAAQGILSDLSALPTGTEASIGEITTNGEGRAAMTDLDGVEELRIGAQTERGHLTIGVRPDEETAYAILDDGSREQIVYPGESPRPIRSDIEEGECGCTFISCDTAARTYVCNIKDGGTRTACGCPF